MVGDMQQSSRILESIRPQLATVSRAFDPINTSGIAAAMRQMQTQQAEVGRFLSLATDALLHTELFKATRQLHELSLQASTALNIFEQFNQYWLTELNDAIKPSVQLASVAKIALADISYHSAITKSFLDSLDFDAMGKHLNTQQPIMYEVQRSITNFMASYCLLTKSFRSIDDLVQLPSFVLPGATRELSITSYALEALYLREQSDDSDIQTESKLVSGGDSAIIELLALLEKVDPGLVRLYTGARDSLSGNNPDRSRHVLTSLRTLWDEIFHRLAPTDDVKTWVKTEGLLDSGYLHNGHPTRSTRLKYVFRDVSNDPLTEFVDADIRTTLALYKVHQRIHKVDPDLTDNQLHAILVKTESSLAYFIKVWAC